VKHKILVSTLVAWVLWSNAKPPDKPEGWVRISATETKRACEEEQAAMVRSLHSAAERMKPGPENRDGTIERTPIGTVERTPAGAMRTWFLFQCWPDTVDPSR